MRSPPFWLMCQQKADPLTIHDGGNGRYHEEAGPCPGECVQGPAGEGTVGVGGHGQGRGPQAGDESAGVKAAVGSYLVSFVIVGLIWFNF